jgi:molecular chaperone GrpE
MSDTENTPTNENEAPELAAENESATPETDLTAEMDLLRDRFLRAVADAENTRKRADKEIKDTRDYAVSSFAKDMVEVADNLERALAALDPSSLDTASEAMKTLVEGVAMTERALLTKMERHGVKKIDPELGNGFDPHVHQAVAQIPSEHTNGTIAAVMQTGFVIGSRTLRAAMVAVSSGPATASAGDGTPGETNPGDTQGETGGNIDLKA